MRLSDVLSSPVTCDGERVGVVVDVRFALDGDRGVPLAEARMLGILVGRRRRETFLGYERTEVTSPALVARLLRWRERHTFLVDRADVVAVTADGVELRPGFQRWSAALQGADHR